MKLVIRNLHTGEIAKEYDITHWPEWRIAHFEHCLVSKMDLDNWCIERVKK